MEFSRPENWSGLLCPSPGDHPNPGIEPRSPELQADSSPSEPPGKPFTQLNDIYETCMQNFGVNTLRKDQVKEKMKTPVKQLILADV